MTDISPRKFDEIPLLPGGNGIGPTLRFRRDRVSFLSRLADGAPLCRLHLLDRKIALVTGAAEVQELLVDNYAHLAKSGVQRFSTYPLLGEGLLNSSGSLWRQQRKCMASLFTPAQIAVYGDSMLACIRREMAAWRDGEVLDIASATTRLTMSIAGKTLFDADTFSETDAIGAALATAIRFFGSQSGSPLTLLYIAARTSLLRVAPHLPKALAESCRAAAARLEGPLLLFGSRAKQLRQSLSFLDRYVAELIAKRRAAPLDEAPPDLLTQLLAAQDSDEQMTDKQVRDEILNLFVAGHETTAVSLAWSLYLLVRHPESYRRAQAEADALPGEPGVAELPRLGYIQRVFKEALRLYSPLPIYTREAIADIVIGGCLIPRGTPIMLSPYATHRRKELWPDAERFAPDRFLPEAEAARPRYAYIPFSAGPRICIGSHFALMEGTLVLATLLQHFDFTLYGRTEILPQVDSALRPKDGVPMRVRRRL